MHLLQDLPAELLGIHRWWHSPKDPVAEGPKLNVLLLCLSPCTSTSSQQLAPMAGGLMQPTPGLRQRWLYLPTGPCLYPNMPYAA